MSKFIKRDDIFIPDSNIAEHLYDRLPKGNYTIGQLPDGKLFFQQVDPFSSVEKIYGNANKHSDRILNTFQDRTVSTGVLLTGEKGSGKTLLARLISLKSDMSTIIVNAPWAGDHFNQLIQSVDQPAIVLFDEFEKVYDEARQEQILTLLDGVFPTKKLFIFTCNNKYKIDQNMKNRPGRIFYNIDYKGLDWAFIEEYCNDKLNNKSYIEEIVKISNLFEAFNFDMLQALVQEMNRYDESPMQSLELLNAKSSSSMGLKQFKCYFTIDGKEPYSYNKDPYANISDFNLHYDISADDQEDHYVLFTSDDMVVCDLRSGMYEYVTIKDKKEFKVVMTEIRKKDIDLFKLL